jgi:phospholipid transport system substrate-binding protein
MLKSSSHRLAARAIAIAAFSVVLLASETKAGEATNQVKMGIESVLNILRDPALKGDEKISERRVKLRQAIGEQFDFNEMSRRSLARQWKNRSTEERIEFVDLFSVLMEKNYVGKIEAYTDEIIKYKKEDVDDDFASVKTIVVMKRKKEIAINYRLHKVAGKWRVYDVVVKGVSLINTYRQQFRSIIKRSSYDGLVKILRRKKNEG